MVGWNNEDVSFVFELTFNYGVRSYARGNDLHHISLHKYNEKGEDMEAVVQKMFPDCAKDADGVYRLINDDFLFKFEDTKADSVQVVKGLCLNVTNLELSMNFYQKVGMKKVGDSSL